MVDFLLTLSSTIYLFIFPGTSCNNKGSYLVPNDAGIFSSPPPCHANHAPNDWTPYWDCIEFETAEFLYCKTQMSASNINTLMDLWGVTLLPHDSSPLFANHSKLLIQQNWVVLLGRTLR